VAYELDFQTVFHGQELLCQFLFLTRHKGLIVTHLRMSQELVMYLSLLSNDCLSNYVSGTGFSIPFCSLQQSQHVCLTVLRKWWKSL